MDKQAEKDKTEREAGLGRRTREETAMWDQMTALRSRQGEDIGHPLPPFGGTKKKKTSHLYIWFQ